jgi:hypothetical protein
MKLEELSKMLVAIDPAAVLVPQTALARVVQNVMGVTWAVWSIPHSHCLAIERAKLHQYIEPEELHLPPGHREPDKVLLLERPTTDQLANSRTKELLTRYWRLLFHASIHRAIEQRLAGMSVAALRERIEQLDPVAFEEARNVLIQDGQLVSGADERTAYIEFVAFFLELRYFSNNLIPVYFPSLAPLPQVEAIIAQDVDGAAIFARTRLPNAPDPTPKTDDQSDESEDFYRRLTQSAERAAAAGDTVGAAILHTRAARVASAPGTKVAQARAKEAIYDLVTRLQTALGLTDPRVQAAWREVLPTLLDKADQGARPVEAALLYDLQRACLDAEQIIYTLDIFEWFQSAGRKPIRRPLDSQRFVRVPEHLRSAIRRLAAARLADADRQALGSLLRDALARAEDRLRERFRPVLLDALSDAGLQPGSLAERAALGKTVDELLDRISSAGFLGYTDVRDAIARGQMKLEDLTGPNEALRGDPLLRLDRRLAHLLDGVYRGAELYTRGLEYMTSVSFGTQVGRNFTRNIALPFGGAFLAAEFVWLLKYERQRNSIFKADEPTKGTSSAAPKALAVSESNNPKAEEVVPAPDSELDRRKPASESTSTRSVEPPSFFEGWNAAWQFHAIWFAIGLFILAIIRFHSMRSSLVAIVRTGYRFMRAIFWDIPLQFWNYPFVRSLLGSALVQLAINYIGKPLLVCGLLKLAAPDLWKTDIKPWLAIFVVVDILLNTRLGRTADLLLLELSRLIIDVVQAGPAVIRWVNDLFRTLLDALEWVLARAEDWLRIRGRSGPMAVAVRVVATIIWSPFAFLIRFYTVVLIEPMLNPLKLPLSILFAKFVYPLLAILGLFTIDPVGSPLVDHLAPVLTWYGAWLIVVGTFYLSPDVVTYLFWEMRENWRLYRANRPDGLGPVAVGPYGETVRGLLHVSFHSGTVPRLYARLRAAELEAAQTDVWRDARTYRQALRGVEEAVRRFVTRDLVVILNGSEAWGGRKLAVETVTLGTNRIRVELVLDGGPNPLWLEWEDRSGWLVAGCEQPGFAAKLPPESREVFENALAYLYKRAGVDLIREQIRACLTKEAVHFDIAARGLLVWYGPRDSTPVLYDPDDPVEELHPRNPIDRHIIPGPTLEASRLVFGRLELTWRQWLAVWHPHDDKHSPRFGPPEWELSLLPPGLALEKTEKIA